MVALKLTSRVEDAVGDALSGLDKVRREVLKRRFGLFGSAAMSYSDLADYLSRNLPASVVLEIASQSGSKQSFAKGRDEAIAISESDVRWLEASGLRELARNGRKKGG